MNIPYLLFSLGGVALLVVFNVMLFGARTTKIVSTQSVEAYLTQILPVFRGRSMSLSADRTAALAENAEDGAIHLVVTRGDTFVTRKLTRPVMRSVERRGDCLLLWLADFTLPHVCFASSDTQTAIQWERKLLGALA